MTALPKTRIFVLGAGLMAVALSAREGHARPLDLRCGDLPPDYCAALTEAILARWPDLGTRDEGAKASLAIELVPTALTAQRIEGHLEWRMADGVRQSGPAVEVSLFDGAPASAAAAELARALVRITDLPL